MMSSRDNGGSGSAAATGSQPRCVEPDAAESSVAESSVAQSYVAERPSKRVLVVDDNEDAAELLREILSCLGHQVEVAYDGPTALAVAESFRPDVALLDIGMPVMNGYELAARLRQGSSPAPRLIAITGYGKESVSEGFDQHLMKPFDVNQLRELIASSSLETPSSGAPSSGTPA
ncbi:MAG TPA: response regulator [Polyangiaceae bacterium]|nr:response regulator [Polyangiaceae bacterium]